MMCPLNSVIEICQYVEIFSQCLQFGVRLSVPWCWICRVPAVDFFVIQYHTLLADYFNYMFEIKEQLKTQDSIVLLGLIFLQSTNLVPM